MKREEQQNSSRKAVDALLAFASDPEDELVDLSSDQVQSMLVAQGTDVGDLHRRLEQILSAFERKAASAELSMKLAGMQRQPHPLPSLEEMTQRLKFWLEGPLGKHPQFAGARNFEKLTPEDVRSLYEDMSLLQILESEQE